MPELRVGGHEPGTAGGSAENPGVTRSSSRRRRRRKLMMIAAAVLAVLVTGTVLAAYVVTTSYLGSVRRISDPFRSIPAAQRPLRPAGAAGHDVTFLVGGVDTRSPVPTTGTQAQSSHRGRTDTLMLVHLIAGGRGAYVVSIPRDSWVPIPGYGYGKVNWAYYFGGPALAVRTVEQLTRVRIDHVAIIDWAGFRDVTNALGGVTVQIPVTSYDPANHVRWTAGTHHLDGAQALLYVRDRYGLPGGDFDRERRQQNFLRAVFVKVHQELSLTNPLQTASVLRALSRAVSVDGTLSDTSIVRLALSLHRLSTGNIVFATVPHLGTGWAGSQSIVRLNWSLDRSFWHAFEYDSLPAFVHGHRLQQLASSTP